MWDHDSISGICCYPKDAAREISMKEACRVAEEESCPTLDRIEACFRHLKLKHNSLRRGTGILHTWTLVGIQYDMICINAT
ncbi:hypothetical protein HJFPF1_12315 [Paramyrothecium foliicola]|nr:hypothetical protein HJFPF1_12315 [Paramyrothecium foliicola]